MGSHKLLIEGASCGYLCVKVISYFATEH